MIRLIVARDLPRKQENALLHLFSAAQEQVRYAAEHYQLQSSDTSSIVNQLFGEYRQEGLTMPYTMEDFRREVALENLKELTPEERLRGMTPKERLSGMTPKELDEIRAHLAKMPKTLREGKQKKSKRRSR